MSARKQSRDRGHPPTDKWQGVSIEGRRLIAEFWGTLLLTLVATGALALHKLNPDEVSAASAAVAPGAMVMAVIYFMGSVSGAHVNPAVTIAFALRRNFPWLRVPGYMVAQLAGAVCGAFLIFELLGSQAVLGATTPEHGLSAIKALGLEVLLTTALVNTILGTASEEGFLGPNAAIPVGAYIGLAGLWAGSLTGASMNPARSIGPEIIGGDGSSLSIYVLGPLLGAAIGVAIEWILKGPPSFAGTRAAQGKDTAG